MAAAALSVAAGPADAARSPSVSLRCLRAADYVVGTVTFVGSGSNTYSVALACGPESPTGARSERERVTLPFTPQSFRANFEISSVNGTDSVVLSGTLPARNFTVADPTGLAIGRLTVTA